MKRNISESLEKAVKVLKQAGAREVYLLGSAGTKMERANSDLDLAVSGIPPKNYFRAMAEAGNLLDQPLDLIDLDEDNPFTRYLKKEGQLERVA